jgi:hypothetical protein
LHRNLERELPSYEGLLNEYESKVLELEGRVKELTEAGTMSNRINNLHKLFPGHEFDAKPIELTIYDKFSDLQEENKKMKEQADLDKSFILQYQAEIKEIRDQILRKRDFYRSRQLNPEKYTYLALGMDDAFKIIQSVTKIKAFH